MTAIHNGTAGEVYYAKPSPVAAGAWDSDDIALTVNPNLSSQFTFENDPAVAYDIYRRAGAEPANTDEIVATVGVSAQAAAAAAITAAGLATAGDVQVTVEPDITINPTELSQESIDAIRDGLATAEGVDEAKDEVITAIGEIETSSVIAVTIPAIEAESIVLGVEVTRYRGTKWQIAVEGLGTLPTKCYATVKRGSEPDASAIAQVVVTDPAAGTDGLKILNGAAAGTASDGSIVITSYVVSAVTYYRATLTLEAAATAAIRAGTYRLDFKDATADIVLGESALKVVNPVTLTST
jgi:hypothetical protein